MKNSYLIEDDFFAPNPKYQNDDDWEFLEDTAPSSSKNTSKGNRKGLGLWIVDPAVRAKISKSLTNYYKDPANRARAGHTPTASTLRSIKEAAELRTQNRLDQTIQQYRAGTLVQICDKKPSHGRPLQTPFGRYDSIRSAVVTTGFSYKRIMAWTETDPKRFYWLDKLPPKVRVPKPRTNQHLCRKIQTSFGRYSSITEAAEAWTKLGVINARKKIYKQLQVNPKKFYYIKETK